MDTTCRLDQPITIVEGGNYRRPLPPGLIAFGSPEGRQIFQEALVTGSMAGYFPLAEQFHTQAEPTFCGISSLVMVLNALEVDPGRIWKGVWRWYDEGVADCCDQLPGIEAEGATLEQLSYIARCNGLSVDMYFQEEGTLAVFRHHLLQVSTAPAGEHMLVSYSRKTVGQTGSGHFSPIGGYHAARDLALILDVARFKYPPHWLPVSLLWEAMADVDTTSARSRGYLLCRKAQ